MNKENNIKLISLLVPCFNEQDTISRFMTTIAPVLESIQDEYEILFIDDGSQDKTLNVLIQLVEQNRHVKVISFSRNFGKEAALTAGLDFVSGDAVIPIDVDLQDPVDLIPSMVARWKAGADVVLARRKNRPSDNMFKRWSVKIFYKLISSLSSTPIPRDVGDYRLMDRVVVDSILLLPEKNRFMKGILSWPGFDTEIIEFSNKYVYDGELKIMLRKSGLYSNSQWLVLLCARLQGKRTGPVRHRWLLAMTAHLNLIKLHLCKRKGW